MNPHTHTGHLKLSGVGIHWWKNPLTSIMGLWLSPLHMDILSRSMLTLTDSLCLSDPSSSKFNTLGSDCLSLICGRGWYRGYCTLLARLSTSLNFPAWDVGRWIIVLSKNSTNDRYLCFTLLEPPSGFSRASRKHLYQSESLFLVGRMSMRMRARSCGVRPVSILRKSCSVMMSFLVRAPMMCSTLNSWTSAIRLTLSRIKFCRSIPDTWAGSSGAAGTLNQQKCCQHYF